MRLFYCLLICFSSLCAYEATPEIPSLIIHNRILARINDKTISLFDVVKKMDVYLAHHHPEWIDSPVARYQFYSAHWREILDQIIDSELILSDAAQIELKVSDGDVREALIERFGPNVMKTIEKIGISYDEAKKMVYTDLLTERMSWYRVNVKILQRVGPHDIKQAYQEYCTNHCNNERWKYQVLSIRSQDSKQSAATAELAKKLLESSKSGLQAIAQRLIAESEEKVAITLSQDIIVDDKDLSVAHKKVLTELSPGEYSKPIVQVSRDQSEVYRIFHLEEHTKINPPSFEEIASKLRDQLIGEAIAKETAAYLSKLRQRFGYKDNPDLVPPDLQPFALR